MPSAVQLSAVDAAVRQSKASRVTKVLVLGNSGVGKSMLCNVLCPAAGFTSAYRGSAVTQNVECFVSPPEDGQVFIYYNIPGLIEADPQSAQRNCQEVESAFRHRAADPTLVLFIFGTEGGRLRDEDLQAWDAMCRYVPTLKEPGRAAFIVNKVETEALEAEGGHAALVQYQAEIVRLLRTVSGLRNVYVGFVPRMSAAERKAPVAAHSARHELGRAVGALQATVFAIDHSSRLTLDRAKMDEEMRQLRDRITSMRQQASNDRDADSQAHRRAVQEMEYRHRRAEAEHQQTLQQMRNELREKQESERRLGDRLQSVEFEAQKRFQQRIDYLTEENAQLRRQISELQDQLQRSQTRTVQLVVQHNPFQHPFYGGGFYF